MPRVEGTGILAASWLSSKWPHRAPEGHVLMRTFVGGARDPGALLRSDAELVARSLAAIRPLLGISGDPQLARVYRWERASAQHEVGHTARLEAIERASPRHPGLFITGSGFRGVGIPDCIADARDGQRRRLAEWLAIPAAARTSAGEAVTSCSAVVPAPRSHPGRVARAGRQLAIVPPDVVKLLQAIKAADTDQLAVSEEDGRFLRVMVAASGATRALEIGGAYGYSAIWIGLGLRQSGGTLTTIEFDPARAKSAAENIRRAGLSDIVTVVPGDALQQIPKIAGTFDFVFLDAWKRDYKRFFDLVFPRLRPGGLFLAHNVVNKESEMRDFLAEIQNNPAVMTTIVSPSAEGMSVTLKLR